jgi:hypothetical protein
MRKTELVLDNSDDEFIQESPSLHTCSGVSSDGFVWDGDEHEYESEDEFADPIDILMRREEACLLQLH